MELVFKPKFKLGQIVYLLTDNEQLERIVTAVMQEQFGFTYKISNGVNVYWASELEISISKDILKTVTS